MGYYPHFNLPMRSSRGFASTAANYRPIKTRFRSGSGAEPLNLLVTVSRRIIMQKARRQAFPLRGIALRPLVGMWFQVHYPPLVGVLPIVRSRYWFAIGRQGVLSLAGWAPRVRTRFHVSGPTQVPDRSLPPSSTGLSPSVADHSRSFRLSTRLSYVRSYNPTRTSPGGLGFSAFARRY